MLFFHIFVELSFFSSVPETYLKKRAHVQRLAKRQAVAAKKQFLASKKLKAIAFHRAKKYSKIYKAKAAYVTRALHQAKATGQFFVPAEPKVFFVIRILGTYGVAPKVRKILELLRLRKINQGAFLRVNKATVNMLLRVTPYVTWGNPSTETIRKLIYKRGFAKINGQRIPITSNELIKKHLGKYGILCIEDIVYQLATCGPKFKPVNSWLRAFNLNTPTGGWRQKKINYVEGGDAGYRREAINNLLARMI